MYSVQLLTWSRKYRTSSIRVCCWWFGVAEQVNVLLLKGMITCLLQCLCHLALFTSMLTDQLIAVITD